MNKDLVDYAVKLQGLGFAPLPVRANGSKAPAVSWKPWLDKAPSAEQVWGMFEKVDVDGLGVITGKSSGNLEMLEVEGRATHLVAQLGALMKDNGHGALWFRIINGWAELSPSGGIHWHYRVTDGPARPNTKLARTAEGLVEIETRGQGGFTVLAPSAGRTHPTGKEWAILVGGPETCPGITSDERDAVFAVASMLDKSAPVQAPVALRSSAPHQEGDPLRPGDDFNARATWEEILVPHGWVKLDLTVGGATCWQRPNKTHEGMSATTGRNAGDNLFVFSTSTIFDTEKPYDKFSAFALLNHSGDYKQAAKALAGMGFGEQKAKPRGKEFHQRQPKPETSKAPEVVSSIDWLGDDEKDPNVKERQKFYSQTDDGNALRFVDEYREIVRYCPQRRSWLIWQGHKWEWDEAGEVFELARKVARSLPKGDGQLRHAMRSLEKSRIEAMVSLSARDSRLVVPLTDLDASEFELNTPAGVVDLRTALLRDPDPKALHTRSTTVAPDFDKAPVQWLNFLADTFAGDEALTVYIQRLLGVSMIGTVLEQLLPFGYGSGANGKTTFVGVIQRLVGIGEGGYSISAPAEMLIASTHPGHPTEIARLAGARLVITSELEDGQRFAEAKIKQLTGRDTISGRFMGKDWFSFRPTHTLWLLANYQPAVRAGGPAFWRRLKLLPFLHTVDKDKRIADLEDRLVEHEGGAILAWVVQGARDYLEHGLAEPQSISTATQAYEADQDTVGRFIDEMCEIGNPNAQGMTLVAKTLRMAYEEFCHSEGETCVSAKALTLLLRSRWGVVSERTGSTRYYAGVRLREDTDRPVVLKPTQDAFDEEPPRDWRDY